MARSGATGLTPSNLAEQDGSMNETAADTHTLVLERVMPHPPEKIWRALTQAPLIEDWLMKNDFEPVVGRRFNFRSTPMPNWDGLVDCDVLAVEPNQRLSYTWNASGEEAARGLKSVVTLTLTPVFCAWSSPASSCKTRPIISAPITVGRNSSPVWSA
jgi:hypothetical protein